MQEKMGVTVVKKSFRELGAAAKADTRSSSRGSLEDLAAQIKHRRHVPKSAF